MRRITTNNHGFITAQRMHANTIATTIMYGNINNCAQFDNMIWRYDYISHLLPNTITIIRSRNKRCLRQFYAITKLNDDNIWRFDSWTWSGRAETAKIVYHYYSTCPSPYHRNLVLRHDWRINWIVNDMDKLQCKCMQKKTIIMSIWKNIISLHIVTIPWFGTHKHNRNWKHGVSRYWYWN